jgi:hypothetical protein
MRNQANEDKDRESVGIISLQIYMLSGKQMLAASGGIVMSRLDRR